MSASRSFRTAWTRPSGSFRFDSSIRGSPRPSGASRWVPRSGGRVCSLDGGERGDRASPSRSWCSRRLEARAAIGQWPRQRRSAQDRRDPGRGPAQVVSAQRRGPWTVSSGPPSTMTGAGPGRSGAGQFTNAFLDWKAGEADRVGRPPFLRRPLLSTRSYTVVPPWRAAVVHSRAMQLDAVFPPMATVFADGSVDRRAIASNVARWAAAGVGGVVALGSNGEAPLVDEDEADRSGRRRAGSAAPRPRADRRHRPGIDPRHAACDEARRCAWRRRRARADAFLLQGRMTPTRSCALHRCGRSTRRCRC